MEIHYKAKRSILMYSEVALLKQLKSHVSSWKDMENLYIWAGPDNFKTQMAIGIFHIPDGQE